MCPSVIIFTLVEQLGVDIPDCKVPYQENDQTDTNKTASLTTFLHWIGISVYQTLIAHFS